MLIIVRGYLGKQLEEQFFELIIFCRAEGLTDEFCELGCDRGKTFGVIDSDIDEFFDGIDGCLVVRTENLLY